MPASTHRGSPAREQWEAWREPLTEKHRSQRKRDHRLQLLQHLRGDRVTYPERGGEQCRGQADEPAPITSTPSFVRVLERASARTAGITHGETISTRTTCSASTTASAGSSWASGSRSRLEKPQRLAATAISHVQSAERLPTSDMSPPCQGGCHSGMSLRDESVERVAVRGWISRGGSVVGAWRESPGHDRPRRNQ